MARVVLLRGVNVGGHRTFQPSVLAKKLSAFGVINVGAAGTLIVCKPVALATLRAALLRELPFKTDIVFCEGRDLIRLAAEDPFGAAPARPDIVRFVSILSQSPRARPTLPMSLPADGKWLLRIIAMKRRFVLGFYRRDMKAIGLLSRIDRLFGASATTRNWNTIQSVVRVLQRVAKDVE